jgi:hypothetical protein
MAFLPGCTTHEACPLGGKVEPAFSLQSALMGRKAGLVLGRDGRSFVSHRTVPLSSPSRLPWQVYGGEGGGEGDDGADAVDVGCHRAIPGRLWGLVHGKRHDG